MILPPLTLVLAVADNGALGFQGKVPWHIPEDLKHFRRLTVGHAVLMGRRTWDEVGKPLPERRNLVISRQRLTLPGAEVIATLEEGLALARTTDADPRVIGGAEIFRLALPLTTRIYLTEVHRSVEADRFFALDRTGFRETERRTGVDPTVEFVTLERIETSA